ncbi:MAG: UDP-glucose 4-epimerase GalE [Bacteroidota bacterium]
MNVLITGGAGYIGSHTIISALENRDWNLISADNFINSTKDTFERISAINGHQTKNYPVNLSNFEETKRIFEENEINGIIHFAALKSVPESVDQPLNYFQNNLNSLLNLIECSKIYNVRHFIFSSSCSVYGNTAELPVKESTPWTKAESPYALTKQMGEQMIEEFIQTNQDLSFISLRYFNPVGAHESGKIGELPLQVPNNLVPYITQTAAGIRDQLTIFGRDYPTRDGTCVRDYIHVMDIAYAHLLAMDRLVAQENESSHEIFNLGTGKGVTVLEAVNAFERVNDLKLNYVFGERRPGDVSEIYADSSKAKHLLAWSPEKSIDEMMKSAWLWQSELMNAN